MSSILLQVQNEVTFWNWPGWTFIGALSAFIAAVATGFYTWFTYHLLSATKNSIDIANSNRETANKLAEFQIYSKLSDQLSSEKVLSLLDTIENGWFDVEEIAESAPGAYANPPRETITGKDIRRHILSPIEDLAKFKDDGLLSMESIDTGFGNTILMLGNSKPIVDYIKYLRKKVYFSDNIHCGFESLYEEELNCCSEEERSKYTNHFKSL